MSIKKEQTKYGFKINIFKCGKSDINKLNIARKYNDWPTFCSRRMPSNSCENYSKTKI